MMDNKLIYNQLLELIGKDEIEKTLSLLSEFVNTHYARFTPEVILNKGRYSQIESEKVRGIISDEDYRREKNRIRENLTMIISSMEGLGAENFKPKKDEREIMMRIAELEISFGICRKKSQGFSSNASRLREKNDIARELGQLFIDYPELIKKFHGTEQEGVITGISNRYKRVPELSGIDFFESLSAKHLGNFTKCCITNALAEILYSGQLSMGDDKRIAGILDNLFPNSYQTVRLSITRVSAELDYFAGNL